MNDHGKARRLALIARALDELGARARADDHRLLGYLIDIAGEEAREEIGTCRPESSAEIVPFRIAPQLRARSGTGR